MAKWGEGDERWKVDELGMQGRNVNSWHWEESNILPWCKQRLEESLRGLAVVDSEKYAVNLGDKVKVNGDAIINRRKGKVIPAYELDVTVDWKGRKKVAGQDAEGEGAKGEGPEEQIWEGEVKLPYISEENHDEDPEIQVTVKGLDAVADEVRYEIVRHGRPVIAAVVSKFVEDLRKGGPDMGTQNGKQERREDSVEAEAAKMVEEAKAKALQKAGSSKIEKRTLEIVEHYYASAKDIYECFTDMGKIRAYTGSPASIEAKEGGAISMFGGSIEGSFRKLEPYTLLEMDWRFSSWPDGSTSKVQIKLEEEDKGSVTLTLRQDGIPDTDRFGNMDVVNMTQAGWKQQVLHRMKQVFGYGI